MHKTTVVATMGAAAAALLALASPASAATKPRLAPRAQTSWPVPASVVPDGIAPGTPRVDWDLCDQPGALYLDLSFPSPTKTAPFLAQWNTFGFTSLRAPASDYYYDPAAPSDPYTPWPAYVTCTVTGPSTVPTGHVPVRFTVTVTDVSNQAVRVAYVTNPKSRAGPNVNYSTWARAHWVLLRPGKSTQFHTPPFLRSARYLPIPGYWLVRPSAGPAHWPNFTEWLNAFPTSWVYLDSQRPTGQCSPTLVPGTVDGIASAPTGGYWVLSSTDDVSACGVPRYQGADPTGAGVSTIAASPKTNGYWVAAAGNVIPFGQARFHGQDNASGAVRVVGTGPTARLVSAPAPTFTGLAATPNGRGYWLVTAYGHVFAYHAPYFGSADFPGQACTGGGHRTSHGTTMYWSCITHLTPAAAAGIAPTDGGKGYVIVAKDGTTARFGKAPSCSLPAGVSVAGLAADYRTGGYWAATTDGHVYACQAPSYPYKAVTGTVTGIAALGNGLGYRLVTSNGKVYDYGAAVWHGDPN